MKSFLWCPGGTSIDMFQKNFILALAVLTGTIIGAGIFGIPYVVSKSGIVPGFFYLLFLGGTVLLIHLFFGEIVLRTKEKHRLPGFAQKYLGNWGKILTFLSAVFGITGALLAFIIIGGDFLKIVLSLLFPILAELPFFYFNLLFWGILSFFIFRGIKLIARAELLMNVALFSVIFLVFAFALPEINFQNFVLINTNYIFLPYGVILFSLIGWSAIPEIKEILGNFKEKKNLKKIITFASIIVVGLYSLFFLVIVGVSGEKTSPEAFQGLLPFLGPQIIILGALFGILAVATSFLVLGNYFKNILKYDFRIPKQASAFIVCGLPLVLFLLGFRDFIGVIGLVGTIIGAIDGIIIILIFSKIKKLGDRQPEYSLKIPLILLYFLIGILALGAISQIL